MAASGGVEAAGVRAMLGLSDRGEIDRPLRARDEGRHRRGARRSMERSVSSRAPIPAADADRACRILPFRHPAEARAETRLDDPAISEDERRARPRIRARPRARAADPRLADPAQGRAGHQGFAAPAGLGRNGADPPRLCRRSADAGGGFAQARRERRGGRRGRRRALRSAAALRAALASRGHRRAARRARPSAPAPADPSATVSRVSRMSSRSPARSATSNCRRRWSSDVRLARFERGSIAFSLVDGASPQIAQTLSRRLQEWTGERWMVALVAGRDARRRCARAPRRAEARAPRAASPPHPLVRKVLERFPGARDRRCAGAEAPATAAAASPAASDDDVGYGDARAIGDDDLLTDFGVRRWSTLWD